MTDLQNQDKDAWRKKYEKEREIERQAILYSIRETNQPLEPHQVSGLALQILTNPDYLEEVIQTYVSRVGKKRGEEEEEEQQRQG